MNAATKIKRKFHGEYSNSVRINSNISENVQYSLDDFDNMPMVIGFRYAGIESSSATESHYSGMNNMELDDVVYNSKFHLIQYNM